MKRAGSEESGQDGAWVVGENGNVRDISSVRLCDLPSYRGILQYMHNQRSGGTNIAGRPGGGNLVRIWK